MEKFKVLTHTLHYQSFNKIFLEREIGLRPSLFIVEKFESELNFVCAKKTQIADKE